MAPFNPPPGFDVFTDSNYHYIPTAGVCIAFIVLYSIATFAHFVEAVYFKLWWLLPTAVLAGLGEILGWSGRYWSSFNGGVLSTPFMIQISTTIISPTPFLAAYFIILGRLIRILGTQYSRLSPRQYTIVFCTADVVALVVQALGGGLASGATDPTPGGNIMLAGIAIQLFFLTVFMALAIEYFYRLLNDLPVRREETPANKVSDGSESSLSLEKGRALLTGKTRVFVIGAFVSCFFLFVRAIYRLIELSDGWNGTVIATQWYFDVFDGAMVVSAMLILNVLHPGYMIFSRSS
ncbi:RTA1 like protein [Schizopora paradoxa]|uniref:RTA1 like protein n=1 Tax=Schizopora paradoxa TaxID=27342 RepID=A0A0H2RGB4_9AGAM|nr:RTA1 like protein [Schizopora paradoxa]